LSGRQLLWEVSSPTSRRPQHCKLPGG